MTGIENTELARDADALYVHTGALVSTNSDRKRVHHGHPPLQFEQAACSDSPDDGSPQLASGAAVKGLLRKIGQVMRVRRFASRAGRYRHFER